MLHTRTKLLLFLMVPLLAAACSQTIEALPTKQSQWRLINPTSYNLKIPSKFFKNQLAAYPNQLSCHTQGLEIIDNEIFISCCLYNPRKKSQRSFAAESFLLKARLSDILENEKGHRVRWTPQKITQPLPAAEQERVTEAVLKQLPDTLATFIKWLFPLDDMQHVLGHPSGLIYDEDRGGLWVANAVYGASSYTHLLLLDPSDLTPLFNSKPIALRNHLGFIGTSGGDRIWSIAWDEGAYLVLIDPRTGEMQKDKLPFHPSIGYQDCDRLDDKTLFCAGSRKNPERWTPHRVGILHALDLMPPQTEDTPIRLNGDLSWQTSEHSLPSTQFGARSFFSFEEVGDIEMKKENHYGNYRTVLPLTNGGMAIGPHGRYVYFLPDDIPNGRLIRFELTRAEPSNDPM